MKPLKINGPSQNFSRYGMAVFIFLCVCAFVTGCFPVYTPGSQELEVVFVKLIPGTNDLEITKGSEYIKPFEYDLLRKHGVRGNLIARGKAGGMAGKAARIMVVMYKNVAAVTELRQPDLTNGLYLQTTNGFILLPENTPTISETFLIRPHHNYSMGDATEFALDRGSLIQAHTAIIWTKKWDGN